MPRARRRRPGSMRRYPAALVVAVTFAAIAADADARRLPFGFNETYVGDLDGATQGEKIALTVASGARLARASLDWRCLEPARDQWNEGCWAAYRSFYDEALAVGVTPMFSLIAAPDWAAAHRCRRHLSRNCAVPPARSHYGEWREVAAEAARRFPRAILEVWNEPNVKAFWNGPPQPKRYGELVRIAYRGVNDTSPPTKVLGGGIVATNGDNPRHMASGKFLRRAFRSNPALGTSMDGLSFHMYGLSQGLGPGSYFRRTVARMRANARRHLPAERRHLWLTETGVSTQSPDSLTEREQEHRLWNAWRVLSRIAIFRGIIYHRLIEPKETSDLPWQHGLAWTRYRRPALLFQDPIKPKPVFCRFARRLGSGYAPCQG